MFQERPFVFSQSNSAKPWDSEEEINLANFLSFLFNSPSTFQMIFFAVFEHILLTWYDIRWLLLIYCLVIVLEYNDIRTKLTNQLVFSK